MPAELHISDEPARAVAERLVELLANSGPVTIALSGGSTPRALFRLLASEYRQAVRWERVTFFQVDERCVPPDHPDSNWRMLREELFAQVPMMQAFRMRAERPDADAEYERILREHVSANESGLPVLDLVLLGMGADGHTASLFPGSAALEENKRLVVFNVLQYGREHGQDARATEVRRLEEHGQDAHAAQVRRLTLTYPILRAARRRWFLVSGADKAAALERVMRGELPAGQLADSEWFVDPAAARGVQGTSV